LGKNETSGMKVSVISILLLSGIVSFTTNEAAADDRFITKVVDTQTDNLELYWKNDKGEIIGTFENLKTWVGNHQKTLLFAMNAGMYKHDFSPEGLFIDNGQIVRPINKASAAGNFHLQPNGIFLITKTNTAQIVTTENFKNGGQIKYATQSRPMLLVNGQIHPEFKKGSKALNIRNGVGILSNNKIIFAMSKEKINLYDFAEFFKSSGCKNALYLDGFVSRMYLPEKNWIQNDGRFGVLIGLTK
jgi:uncharacterized protein YigE (DUF2233 family)